MRAPIYDMADTLYHIYAVEWETYLVSATCIVQVVEIGLQNSYAQLSFLITKVKARNNMNGIEACNTICERN